MTIKTLGISAAASAILASSVFAGTISSSATGKVAEEWFIGATERNVTIANAAYTTSIDGSGTTNAPTFVYRITGGVVASDPTQYVIVDTSDGNRTITTTGSDDNGTLRFSSLTDATVYNNHAYELRLDGVPNVRPDLNVTVTKDQVNTLQVCVELWSTSGTEVKIDEACGTPYALVPQYSVTCENKFNNLINVESQSYAFVTTSHSTLLNTDNSTGDQKEVLSDVMRFKVTKTAVDYGLEGNNSVLSVIVDNNTTFPIALDAVSDNFADGAFDPSTVTDLLNGTTEINVTDASTATTNGFYGLGASENTYTVVASVTGTDAIPAVHFTASFAIDGNVSLVPADPAYEANTNVGSWSEFAYIAQIPGATSDDYTKTKLFVTNRSCKTVTPQLRLILDGQVTTVDYPMSIAPNTQGKVLLGDILAAHNLPSGRYSVEVVIPGNAEDFYVYAQAQSRTDLAATKDLPVYSTSTRSN